MIIISANAVNRMLDPEKKPYTLPGGCFVSGTVKKVLGGTIAGLVQVLKYKVFFKI